MSDHPDHRHPHDHDDHDHGTCREAGAGHRDHGAHGACCAAGAEAHECHDHDDPGHHGHDSAGHGHHGHDHGHAHGGLLGHDHGHGHGHDHDHSHVPNSPRRLLAVVALTTTIFLAEAIGGWLTGSLALLADAGHMLTDAAGLIMALVALLIGRRAATDNSTYGLRRAEVLAALVNALTVLGIGVVIAYGAVRRMTGEEVEIHTTPMIIVAVVGLVANLIGMMLLAAPAKDSVNIRGAYLHVLVDALGSVAVIISGIVIAATGWNAIDAVVSLLLAGLIVPRSVQLLLRCLGILMERTPAGIDAAEIRAALEAIAGVAAVHDLHVWSVSGTEVLLTAHLVADPAADPGCDLLDAAQDVLRERFGIDHSTIQIEEPAHAGHEADMHP